MMNALDDAGVGIELGDAAAELVGVAVALGDEDGAGAGQVRGRLAQGAARQEPLVAERLLAVDEHDVLPPAAEFPVLEPVVEQQRVAAEFLDGVTAALDPVLVHQHDHILEVGGEHVGLVARHLGIQQQRFAVGNHARRRGVIAEEEFVQQPLMDGAAAWSDSRGRGWRRCGPGRAARGRTSRPRASCRCRRRSGCRRR